MAGKDTVLYTNNNTNNNDPFRVQRAGNKMVDNNSMYVIHHSKALVFGGKKKTIINIELW